MIPRLRAAPGPRKSYRLAGKQAEFAVMHSLLCWLIAAAESMLALAFLAGRLTPLEGLATHLGIVGVAATATAVVAARRRDIGLLALLTITCALTGPLGAIGVAAMSTVLVGAKPSAQRLDGWYARLRGARGHNRVEELYQHVATGRRNLEEPPLDRSFTEVLRSGSVADQQTVLGLIARHFHADFVPVLRLALSSREAAIRTQAATVANSLPPAHRNRIWGMTS